MNNTVCAKCGGVGEYKTSAGSYVNVKCSCVAEKDDVKILKDAIREIMNLIDPIYHRTPEKVDAAFYKCVKTLNSIT